MNTLFLALALAFSFATGCAFMNAITSTVPESRMTHIRYWNGGNFIFDEQEQPERSSVAWKRDNDSQNWKASG